MGAGYSDLIVAERIAAVLREALRDVSCCKATGKSAGGQEAREEGVCGRHSDSGIHRDEDKDC